VCCQSQANTVEPDPIGNAAQRMPALSRAPCRNWTARKLRVAPAPQPPPAGLTLITPGAMSPRNKLGSPTHPTPDLAGHKTADTQTHRQIHPLKVNASRKSGQDPENNSKINSTQETSQPNHTALTTARSPKPTTSGQNVNCQKFHTKSLRNPTGQRRKQNSPTPPLRCQHQSPHTAKLKVIATTKSLCAPNLPAQQRP